MTDRLLPLALFLLIATALLAIAYLEGEWPFHDRKDER
jgi:hypothetical protein